MPTTAVEALLVEDNATDEELIVRAFKSRNLASNIAVVRDGEAALQFLLATGPYEARKGLGNPRVVFLDLKLPKLDGIEVVDQLRANARTRSVPVVMLTSSREERDVLESYRVGANSYVVKPLHFEEFARTVGDVAAYWLRINQSPG